MNGEGRIVKTRARMAAHVNAIKAVRNNLAHGSSLIREEVCCDETRT